MIYTDWPMDDYHADDSVTRSDICRALISAAHYRYQPARKASAAMGFGTAFHAAALQPYVFNRTYRVLPTGMVRRGKAYEAFCAANPADYDLSSDDYDAIVAMRESVMAHPVVGQAIREAVAAGHVEESILWDDGASGLRCKCRPDARRDGVIYDLKSAADARPKAFGRAVYDYGYHIQAAHYCAGCAAEFGEPYDMRLVVVEKEPPYEVVVYSLSDDALAVGRSERSRGLGIIAAARETRYYPGYSKDVQPLDLPVWAE